MATADRMARDAASKRAAAARKKRGMKRSTARSVGRTVSKATSRAASSAAMRKQADARSGRSTTSPRGAMIQRSIGNALTRIPGVQDKNSDSNKNARSSATRVVQASRARVAAEKGGTQRSRSAQARAMNRNRRGPAQRRRQGK